MRNLYLNPENTMGSLFVYKNYNCIKKNCFAVVIKPQTGFDECYVST